MPEQHGSHATRHIARLLPFAMISFAAAVCLVCARPTPALAEDPPTYVLQWGSTGGSDGQFMRAWGVAASADGYVYVTDRSTSYVHKFTSSGVWVAKWGGFGSLPGEFSNPAGIATDALGDVYVADVGNNRIQKFSPSGTFIMEFVGVKGNPFSHPNAVAVSSTGDVLVADTGNNRIQRFSSSGAFLAQWPALGNTQGVAVDAAGDVFHVEYENFTIWKYTSAGGFLTSWGSRGPADGQMERSAGLACDVAGNVYLADTQNSRVQKFSGTGTFLTKWGSLGTGDGQFVTPSSISVDASGNVYVADPNQNRIQKFAVSAPPTPEEQIAILGDGVEALVAGGALLPAQGNSLLTKLDAALSLMTNGNTQGATAKLTDFIKQVSNFIKTGKLTSRQGQPLIDAAQALINEIQAAAAATASAAAPRIEPDVAQSGRPGVAPFAVPQSFRLYPATPDAVRGVLTLHFDLPRSSDVTIEFYDLGGRRLDEVRAGTLGPGRQEWSWTARNHSSALVFYRLKAGEFMAAGKAALVR